MTPDDSPHWFIVPALRGALSGGTLYNRGLLGALDRRRLVFQRVDLERGRAILKRGTPGTYWVDSLYLDAFSELLRARGARQQLGVLLHYLPTLVAHGDAATTADLSAAERCALAEADVLLVPSRTLRDAASRFGAERQRILVVEPGRPRVRAASPEPELHGVLAVMIGNVVPGKGVHALLVELARELQDRDALRLCVVGGTTRDPPYARRCLDAVENSPLLRARVSFRGELAPPEAVRAMATGNAFVSASVQESYGMALAEARTAGVPLLAHAGGHSAAHVDPDAGGELVSTHTALARACIRLARDPAEHARRIERALSQRYAPRSWRTVAGEFMAELESRGL
ncbi:MAG TPA: glycosyltransferase family 4 protein [Polyangiaceae bacterium]